MKRAKIFIDGMLIGYLVEWEKNHRYEFTYLEGYVGSAVSLTMPLTQRVYCFDRFPPFFDGFLPEGLMLDALLRKAKLDRDDRFEQLTRVGKELVGNITVEKDESMPNYL